MNAIRLCRFCVGFLLHFVGFLFLSLGGCECGIADSPPSGAGGFSVADGGPRATDAAEGLDRGEEPPAEAGENVSNDDGGAHVAGAASLPLDEFCGGAGPWVHADGRAPVCLGDLATETFRFGLCSCSALGLGGSLRTDSYRSSRGVYGAVLDSEGSVNLGQDGHVGVAGETRIDKKIEVAGSFFATDPSGLQLGPGSEVTGNLHSEGPAWAASNTHVRIGRNAFVRGSVDPSYHVDGTLFVPSDVTLSNEVDASQIVRTDFPAPPICDCDTSTQVDIPSMVIEIARQNDNDQMEDWVTPNTDGGAASSVRVDSMWADPDNDGPRRVAFPCGRYYLQNIHQSQALQWVIQGRVALFVDGDFRSSGLSVELNDDAELDLFITGDFYVQSAVTLGSSHNAARMRFYIGGNVHLDASSELVGNFYAPNAHFETNGAARIFGAVLAQRITLGAGTELHFDSDVRHLGETCPLARTPPDLDGGTAPPSIEPAEDACATGCDPECLAPSVSSPEADQAVVAPERCAIDTDCCAPGVCVEGACVIFAG